MIPGMCCTANVATPSLFLHFQPLWETYDPNHFHILQYTLPVRILCVRNKLLHKLTGFQFVALIAELKPLAYGASLDAACSAKPGGLFAFATVTLLILITFSNLCRQHDRTRSAIHTAIALRYKVHSDSPFIVTNPAFNPGSTIFNLNVLNLDLRLGFPVLSTYSIWTGLGAIKDGLFRLYCLLHTQPIIIPRARIRITLNAVPIMKYRKTLFVA